MKRAIKALVLIFVAVFCFAGCSQVSFSVIQHPDGSITERLTITLDVQKMEQLGFDSDGIANLMDEIEASLAAFRNSLNLLQGMTYKTETNANVIYAEMRYVDAKTFNRHKGIVAGEPELERLGLFTTKLIFYRGVSPIASFSENPNSLTWHFLNYVETNSELAKALGDDFLQQVALSYTHGTLERRMRSDADIKQRMGSVHYHTWHFNLSPEQLNRQIEMYAVIASAQNRVAWYGLAFLLVAVAMAVALLVYRRRNVAGQN